MGATQATWKTTVWYVVLTSLSIVVLFPVYMTLVRALSTPAAYVREGQPLYPVDIQWDIFRRAFVEGDLGRKLALSAVVTVVIVGFQLGTSLLAAYAFAFLDFPFKRTLFVVFMATLMLPIEVTLIPNVDTIRTFSWLNSIPGLTAPFLATAFGTFLIRQGFLGIPRDLRDASGARRFRAPRVPSPSRHTRDPPRDRLVRRHRVPECVEPVHLASGGHHRGSLGDDPDRPQVALGGEGRGVQHRPRRGADRRPPRADAAHLPATPAHTGPHRRRRERLRTAMRIRIARHRPPDAALQPLDSRNRARSVRVASIVVALVLAGCSGASGDGTSANATAAGGAADLPACPLDALAKASEPVEVVVWHSYQAKTKDSLEQLAAQYNASQSKVKVRVENQGTSYAEVWRKYQAAAKDKQLPGIAILEEIDTQAVADSATVLPAQSCINAAHTDMSDFVKPAIDFYSVRGALIPATLNLSSPLLYYNRNHFRRAGLDPDKPPTTLAELRQYAEKIKAAGIVDKPIALSLQPWFYEEWLTGAGAPTVNNDNGRGSGTTDAAAFNSDAGRQIMTWLSDTVKAGLVDPIPYTGGNVGQYLAMANQKASMTIETSTAATSIKAFLSGDTSVAAGQDASNVDLTALDINAAEVPGLTAAGKGQISGGAWYITNTTPPEVQAAAWDFITWWNRTETQVAWNLQGSYLPFRLSAAKDAALVDAWHNDISGRWLAISYDQLINGVDPTFPGPLIGPWDQTRDAIGKAMDGVAFSGQAPDAALNEAADTTTKALQTYNRGS